MNITDLSSTGWPQYWVDRALEYLVANGNDDGVFADSYTQDIIFDQVSPSISWFNDVNECNANWIPLLDAFGKFCHNALNANGYYYLPNLGGLVTSWDKTNYGIGDGGMNEGFCRPSVGNYWPIDGGWGLASNRLLKLARQDKIILCETTVSESNIADRMFVFGTYLLLKGAHSYIHMIDGNAYGAYGLDGNLVWWPEYGINLGAYDHYSSSAILPPSSSALRDSHSGVYVRKYAKGRVLVNPNGSDLTYSFSGTWYMVGPNQVTGGGTVAEDGSTSGSFSSVAVSSSVTVPAHSAVILLTQHQQSSRSVSVRLPEASGTTSAAGTVAPFWW